VQQGNRQHRGSACIAGQVVHAVPAVHTHQYRPGAQTGVSSQAAGCVRAVANSSFDSHQSHPGGSLTSSAAAGSACCCCAAPQKASSLAAARCRCCCCHRAHLQMQLLEPAQLPAAAPPPPACPESLPGAQWGSGARPAAAPAGAPAGGERREGWGFRVTRAGDSIVGCIESASGDGAGKRGGTA
jgi:hypothetical protein